MSQPAAIPEAWFHRELTQRRDLLERFEAAEARELIRQVDAALDRLSHGSYGVCTKCEVQIEESLLRRDPLASVCLECLSERDRRFLERDLEMAAHIQSSLIPKPAVSFGRWELGHSYQPHGVVSGDYYDVFSSGDESAPVYFLVGDVSGKGVAASLVMAQFHAAFRSLIPFNFGLSELVQRVNRLIVETTPPATYATLVVGRLEASGSVEICNAGHQAPLVVRSEAVERLPATGLPVGLFAGAHYPTEALRLEGDDLVLLYTDGLSEAVNSSGAEFGIESVVSSLPRWRGQCASDVARYYAELVNGYRETTGKGDDMTIVAIRRKGL